MAYSYNNELKHTETNIDTNASKALISSCHSMKKIIATKYIQQIRNYRSYLQEQKLSKIFLVCLLPQFFSKSCLPLPKNGIAASVRCVVSTLFVLKAKLPCWLRHTQKKKTVRSEETRTQ